MVNSNHLANNFTTTKQPLYTPMIYFIRIFTISTDALLSLNCLKIQHFQNCELKIKIYLMKPFLLLGKI